MNTTTTGLSALALTSTLLLAGACGSHQADDSEGSRPKSHAQARVYTQSHAQYRAQESARRARAEKADALRAARGHLSTPIPRSCRLSPSVISIRLQGDDVAPCRTAGPTQRTGTEPRRSAR